jgi:hypothetical protein
MRWASVPVQADARVRVSKPPSGRSPSTASRRQPYKSQSAAPVESPAGALSGKALVKIRSPPARCPLAPPPKRVRRVRSAASPLGTQRETSVDARRTPALAATVRAGSGQRAGAQGLGEAAVTVRAALTREREELVSDACVYAILDPHPAGRGGHEDRYPRGEQSRRSGGAPRVRAGVAPSLLSITNVGPPGRSRRCRDPRSPARGRRCGSPSARAAMAGVLRR